MTAIGNSPQINLLGTQMRPQVRQVGDAVACGIAGQVHTFSLPESPAFLDRCTIGRCDRVIRGRFGVGDHHRGRAGRQFGTVARATLVKGDDITVLAHLHEKLEPVGAGRGTAGSAGAAGEIDDGMTRRVGRGREADIAQPDHAAVRIGPVLRHVEMTLEGGHTVAGLGGELDRGLFGQRDRGCERGPGERQGEADGFDQGHGFPLNGAGPQTGKCLREITVRSVSGCDKPVSGIGVR